MARTLPNRGPDAARGRADQRDDGPVVELVVDAEALKEIAVTLKADASLFDEGAGAYASGVQDTVEAIRELAQRARRQVGEDAQP